MRCPCCPAGVMNSICLDELFLAHECSECGGHWLLLEDYLRWLKSVPPVPLEAPLFFESVETKYMIPCPVTGKAMLKFRISGQTEHRVDLSPAVSGVWMDKGEWELLKSEGLAHRLRDIFSMAWQKRIHAEKLSAVMAVRYEEKYGEEVYGRLKEFRSWLYEQDNAMDLLAYLVDPDPYRPVR